MAGAFVPGAVPAAGAEPDAGGAAGVVACSVLLSVSLSVLSEEDFFDDEALEADALLSACSAMW